MEEYRPTVGQIITMFRLGYFTSTPSETPILQSARFTAALWYQNLCFPHCACTAYGMRRKRRNPLQTPSHCGINCRTVFRFCSSRKAAETF